MTRPAAFPIRATRAIAMLIGVPCAALPCAGAALAQGRPVTAPVDTVAERARPDYDAVGIPLGGFTVFPEVAVGAAYDDNIYRTATMKRDDGYAELRPRVRIVSPSRVYPVAIEADATVRRYASIQTENSEQYGLSADAAAEIGAGTRVSLAGGYERRLEPRGSAGDLFVGGDPITYHLLRIEGSASHGVGALGIEAGGSAQRYDYAAVRINGARIGQDFGDFRSVGGHVRLAYAVGPAIAAFVRGGFDASDYPKFDGLDRSSKGFSVLAGVQLGLGNLVTGSVGVGYLRENFADPAYGDISGIDYDVALNWNPTPLVSVSLRGSRSLQRSPFVGSAGGISTNATLGVQYELLRQLILTSDVSYTRESYRGLDRDDDYVGAQLGARYLVNRTLSLTASVNYRRQTSSGVGARDFDGFGAAIGVTLHR
ncbi:outer membrane beta-barrel protein [Sphingomonas profundi]|uniref:outer membrane beta-barrel protein n=1 Tax=Alterirhizorhabdus profundi TaxID=2681549 RepID=UPI0018D0693F|nr:outer membrane beta-barrel protein [Sphingomonas profundi]